MLRAEAVGCGCGTRRSLVAGKVWQSQRLGPRASVGREGLTFHGLVAVKCGIPQTVDFDLSSVLDGEVRTVSCGPSRRKETCLRLRVPTRKHGSVRGAFVPAVPGGARR